MATKWTEISTGLAGTPHGHVPGHRYHDVDVTIQRSDGRWRVEVVETWGSAQGRDVEDGRRQLVATESTLRQALADARDKAARDRVHAAYLEDALAASEADALDALDALESRRWTEISTGAAGTPHGHVAGHRYHDVDVTIQRSDDRWRVEVVETWGASQGCDVEDGRRRVVAIESTIHRAIAAARVKATRANVHADYLEDALEAAYTCDAYRASHRPHAV